MFHAPSFWLHLISHSTVAMMTGLLWHQTNQWSSSNPSSLSYALIIFLSLVSGIVLSHLLHEWGHFIGAVLSRSRYTLKSKISPLFFDFDYVKNTPRQYLWLSFGGLAGNIFLITTTLLSFSLHTLGQPFLLASIIGQFAYVLVLELPVSIGILAGKNPLEVLSQHFAQGKPLFLRSLLAGISSGVLILACLVSVS